MSSVPRQFVADEGGADLIEYALLVGLLSMACFLAMTSLSTSLNGMFNRVATKLGDVLP
jgi:Flp pilus assembly pilin Flp